MEISAITVTAERTVSLSNYSNAKFGLQMTALLSADDAADGALIERLFADIQTHVEEHCNQALEADDQPARFYDGPRYVVVWSPLLQRVYLAFQGIEMRKMYGDWRIIAPRDGHRLDAALRLAHQTAQHQSAVFRNDAALLGEPEDVYAAARRLVAESNLVALVNIRQLTATDTNGRAHVAIVPAAFVAELDQNTNRYFFDSVTAAQNYLAEDDSREYTVHYPRTLSDYVALVADDSDERPF